VHAFQNHPAPFTHGGATYDFAHLASTVLKLNLADCQHIVAECRFKSHCYTRKPGHDESLAGLVPIHDERGELRVLCPVRYHLSFLLVAWISKWRAQPCVFGKNFRHGVENWIVVEWREHQRIKVAFSVDKHELLVPGIMMWIKTVHPYDRSRPPVAGRVNSIPFQVLVKTVAYTGQLPRVKTRK